MQNVRDGYKMTELGDIPAKWEVCKIEEACESVDYRGKTPEKVQDGIYLITAKNIAKGYIDYEVSKEYIKKEDYTKVMSRGLPKIGDVLFTTEAPLGNVANVDNEQIALAQRVIKFRGKSGILDNYYLKYFMLSDIFQNEIYQEATGSTVLGIKGSRLKKINLIIPSFKEQQKLALILSTVDEQIEITDNFIEKTKELKKGLMQRLFTKGIGHDRFKDTEIGRIPEEWEIRELRDVADIISGGTPNTKQSEYWDNGNIFWATPTDITASGKYISKTTNCITEIGLKNSSANLLPVGTILMTSRATIGERCINKTPMCTNQGFKSFICKDDLYNEFMFYLVELIKKDLIALSAGSTFLEISKSSVENYKIALPEVEEQKQIASILSAVDGKIDQYECKKEKLQDLKKGLMQKLLTGKIRVKV